MAKKNPTEEMKREVSKVYREMEKITPKKLGADAMPKKKYSEKAEPKKEEKKESKMSPSARKKVETKERKK